jgi:hypothetical protein
MHRCDIERLDSTRTYWVPAVVSPERNWIASPGCRRGARFLVNCRTLQASREEFDPFDSELSCLSWIMRNRVELNRKLPHARVRPVRLTHWLLGLE